MGVEPAVVEVELVVFDLDGTLTDSRPGITKAYRRTLEVLGLPPVDAAALDGCLGPPIRECLTSIGVPAGRLDEAVRAYREWFVVHGIFDNAVYDGVVPMLTRLRYAGVPTALATAKLEQHAHDILAHFRLDGLIDGPVCGASLDGTRVEKGEILAEALRRAGIAGSPRVLMVGDRAHDVRGGLANGVRPVGAGWGYGAPGELAAAGAAHILDRPEDLADLVLSSERAEPAL
ncbi:MAG TPA: HAD hydrolase-like protein [Acidimicrobiales bacterium]|nr:HAD hydrolase-like protein [Acidimicrobiales bacterium]